jgi:hypothetical protein
LNFDFVCCFLNFDLFGYINRKLYDLVFFLSVWKYDREAVLQLIVKFNIFGFEVLNRNRYMLRRSIIHSFCIKTTQIEYPS